MKIVHINFWYSKGFGYTENMLPKALVKLGHEVHLITSNTQIYWYEPMYKDVYEARLGPGITACDTFNDNGVTVHRLPHFLFCPFKSNIHQFEQFGIRGIYQMLEKLKPDVIQTQGINLYSTFYAARYAKKNSIKLFTENHIHKSVFNPGNKQLKKFYNNINPFLYSINKQTNKCFPIAPDAEELTREYYKVPKRKIQLQTLGVDTDMFYYKDPSERIGKESDIRQRHGFTDDDILVIYTGRFTDGKNPYCLAKAIDILHTRGESFKGLFVGRGSESYTAEIQQSKGCHVIDFQPVSELPYYYWAADIGVWPSQESMSQIDALSCGLPLVLSNKIEVLERIEGNGYLYEEDNVNDLVEQLLKLKNQKTRIELGKHGASKVEANFSWNKIAKIRTQYYLGDLT